MRRNRKVTVTFSRVNDEDQEFCYSVKCEVTPGRRATRLDPPEDAEVEILDIISEDGAPALEEDDLDPSEVEKISVAAQEAAAEEDRA